MSDKNTQSKETNKKTKFLQQKTIYILVSIFILVTLIMGFLAYSIQKTPINFKIGKTNIGFMSLQDAKTKTAETITKYNQQKHKFIYKDKIISLTNEELGIKPNLDLTIQSIKTFNLLNPLTIGSKTTVIYTINTIKLTKTLEQKFQINRAKNATLTLINEPDPNKKDKQIEKIQITNEKTGQKIDTKELIQGIKLIYGKLQSTPIQIKTIKEEPTIKVQDIEQYKDILNKKITLTSGKKSFTLELKKYPSALIFKKTQTATINGKNYPIKINNIQDLPKSTKVKTNLIASINIEPIQKDLDENILKDIQLPPSHAKIYRDENDKVIIEGKGENGKTVMTLKLQKIIELALNNNIYEIKIPITIIPAKIEISEDLQKLGIKQLLATGHSAYYGSPRNRKFNISFGTQKYNGLLIAPDEEFSFNKVLGPVDAKSGFKPEKVIKQNKIKNEYGGGICQVSTTLYRAALQAGFPITERKPHSWKVSYYGQSMGHGLDATIYPGVADVKFINDTPNYILIQAYVEGTSEDYFKIYGTKDGRKVDLLGPYGGGLSYRWEREITKNGKTEIEKIFTRYKPIPANPTGEPEKINNKFNLDFQSNKANARPAGASTLI